MIDIFCVKYGTLYKADHVNILYKRLQKYLNVPFKMTCLTDDKNNILKDIDIIDIEPNDLNTFNKIKIYNPAFLKNNKTLYFDLDVVIQNDVTFLLDSIYYGGITTIPVTWSTTKHNELLPYGKQVYMQGNSSIVGFYGDDPEVHKIYYEFVEDEEYILQNFVGGDDIYLLNYMHEYNMFEKGKIYSYENGVYADTSQLDHKGQSFTDLEADYIDDQANIIRPMYAIGLLSHIKDKNFIFYVYEKYFKVDMESIKQ